MPVLNAWRIFSLATLSIVLYFAFFKTDDEKSAVSRKKRAPTMSAWNNLPSTCNAANQMALTFDEGATTPQTLGLLDGLVTANLKATFHVISAYLTTSTFNATLKRVYTDGHVVGIRLRPALTANTMTIAALQAELLSEAQAVRDVIGVYPKFVRFAYGDMTPEILAMLDANGFVATGFSVDSQDYAPSHSVNEADKASIGTYINAQATANGYPSISPIVILRANLDVTANNIVPIVAALRNASASRVFVTLDKCRGIASPYRTSNDPPGGAAAAPTTPAAAASPTTTAAVANQPAPPADPAPAATSTGTGAGPTSGAVKNALTLAFAGLLAVFAVACLL
ncbi:uncharacterized protein EV422DRAFT_525956 [Fimicolochytrium jonesii]|uniref:uncharacterized protein n=1 Tax=Fimicolochytrium jonesii TaxID=1396493 RepID=UPI0022FE4E05|nr:uncharacterized protein EV422DRAFT_525956 [Fimicolochytrium jonesii]KAI8822176.1 hypothetical protein EV422DRAFT_525956 [Fimicolochytrium jonesii]